MSKILVVDDDPNISKVLEGRLESMGYQVVLAEDGEKGIQLAHEAKPDLILCDILMPGKDGFEVCWSLKADEQTMNIPIIMLTALEETKHKVVGLKSGADDYISKPFQPDELLARIEVHLRIKKLRDKLELSYVKIKELSNAKDALNQLIVHDFKNSLISIKECLGILKDKSSQRGVDKEEKKALSKALRCCDAQLKRIDSLS